MLTHEQYNIFKHMSMCFAESRGSTGVRAERGFESTFKNHPNKLHLFSVRDYG